MTALSTWHAPSGLLRAFATDPAGLDAATAGSVEMHLVGCETCRTELAGLADPAIVASSWQRIAERIDQPRVTALERLLRRAGVSGGGARLAAGTPGLFLAATAGLSVVVVSAVIAAHDAGASGPFLYLAPLVPLAAVAVTFMPAAEPAGEAGIATPLHGAVLLLRRAAAVLVPTVVLLGVASFAVPGLGPLPLAWLVPSVALTAMSLAASTWLRIELVAAGLASGWCLSLTLLRRYDGGARPLIDSVAFDASGQLVAVALTVCALAVLAVRADRLVALEVRG